MHEPSLIRQPRLASGLLRNAAAMLLLLGLFMALPACSTDRDQPADESRSNATGETRVSEGSPATGTSGGGSSEEREGDPKRIRIETGATSARVAGTIARYDTDHYVAAAKGGEQVRLTLESPNEFMNFVVSQGEENLSAPTREWAGTLPASGDYRIVVFLMRGAARRGEQGEYTLTLAIE